jgi:hypothetical protein
MTAARRTKHVRITQEELQIEASLRFGADPLDYAFQCPNCDDVATIREFKDANTSQAAPGQDCIGRHLGALDKAKHASADAYRKAGGRGCDWAAYGLFRGPWEIVVPAENGNPERSIYGFPLAGDPATDGPVARYLAAKESAR